VADEEALVRRLISVPVLLLDGLGPSTGNSGWAAGRWTRIFEARAQSGRPWAVAARSFEDLAAAFGGEADAEYACDRACALQLRKGSMRQRRVITRETLLKLAATAAGTLPSDTRVARVGRSVLPSGDAKE
jgi:hypothetical protein